MAYTGTAYDRTSETQQYKWPLPCGSTVSHVHVLSVTYSVYVIHARVSRFTGLLTLRGGQYEQLRHTTCDLEGVITA
jgi:hypothetical protein